MNHILSALPRADARWLLPRLKPVQLKARDELETSNQPVKRVFFIETGIAAVVSNSGKASIALGLIGCEGSSAVAVMLGDTRSPHSTVMLNDGTALSASADELREAMEHCPRLSGLLLRYVLAFYNQVAHTALANAMSSVEQRVARWVLMTHDRVAKHEIPLTHELIASMLGIRRAGVSTALKQLENAKLIEIGRGCVRILKLKGIREIAGDFYGLPEKEFLRLIGGAGHR